MQRQDQAKTSQEEPEIDKQVTDAFMADPQEEQSKTDVQPSSIETRQDQLETTEQSSDLLLTEKDQQSIALNVSPTQKSEQTGFDWLAMGIVIVVAGLFALTARFNSQPASSFLPEAVLSATGCGLLVTALRKLRTKRGAGLLEAALGGFFMALFQFAVSLTYPDIVNFLQENSLAAHGYYTAWGLVGAFATVFSLIGAAIGHLAFAPLRPLTKVRNTHLENDGIEAEDDELAEYENDQEEPEYDDLEELKAEMSETTNDGEEVADNEDVKDAEHKPDMGHETDSEAAYEEEEEAEESEDENADETNERVALSNQARRSFANAAVAVLLLALLPMVVGYVFAAAYDFTLNSEQIAPGLYPTLRVLSSLLPWQIATPIDLSTINGPASIFELLWRIPNFPGNPTIFDVQALEAFIFNGSALALILTTMYEHGSTDTQSQAPWRIFLLLEGLMGLFLTLPSDLWLLQGLKGVLQFQSIAIALRTLQLLDPTMFVLNAITGPVVCILIGLIVRRQYHLWTMPQENESESSTDDSKDGFANE